MHSPQQHAAVHYGRLSHLDVYCYGRYRYRLSESQDDDLERLRNNNKYRLAASFGSASQAIADFSCINSFLSPLALLAGTNKCVPKRPFLKALQRAGSVDGAFYWSPLWMGL